MSCSRLSRAVSAWTRARKPAAKAFPSMIRAVMPPRPIRSAGPPGRMYRPRPRWFSSAGSHHHDCVAVDEAAQHFEDDEDDDRRQVDAADGGDDAAHLAE